MRPLAFAIALLLPATLQAAVLCPAAREGRVLREVTLFDGPPVEMASLVPVQRGQRDTWDVAVIRQGGRQGHLVCGYGGAAGRLEVPIPTEARACTTTRAPGNRSFSAVDCR